MFEKETSLRSGMPNRSIAKAMLEDRTLGSQPGGLEIKLKYNIFTNIMTRMLSKKYIAYK